MRTRVLGSGSRGNAIVVDVGSSRLLIDAGFPPRILAARLAAAGIAPESISALILTHEHHDHARGACAAMERWGWRVYATPGTLGACAELAPHRCIPVTAGATVSIDDAEVQTVRVPHDAAQPVALVITERQSGARMGLAYDLGVVTQSVRSAFQRLDVLVIEANHDAGMLRAGPYPPSLQQRIAGPHGHLRNEAAAELVAECAHAGLRDVVLAHLSEQCNDPALAERIVRRALLRAGRRATVHVASQRAVLAVHSTDARARSTDAGARDGVSLQLALGI